MPACIVLPAPTASMTQTRELMPRTSAIAAMHWCATRSIDASAMPRGMNHGGGGCDTTSVTTRSACARRAVRTRACRRVRLIVSHGCSRVCRPNASSSAASVMAMQERPERDAVTCQRRARAATRSPGANGDCTKCHPFCSQPYADHANRCVRGSCAEGWSKASARSTPGRPGRCRGGGIGPGRGHRAVSQHAGIAHRGRRQAPTVTQLTCASGR